MHRSSPPVIATLQIFPSESGVRVDLGTVSAPEHASPTLETLSQALAQVAVAVISDPDLGILDGRRTNISLCPVSLQPSRTPDEGPTQ